MTYTYTTRVHYTTLIVVYSVSYYHTPHHQFHDGNDDLAGSKLRVETITNTESLEPFETLSGRVIRNQHNKKEGWDGVGVSLVPTTDANETITIHEKLSILPGFPKMSSLRIYRNTM